MVYGYASNHENETGANIYFIRDNLGSIKIGVARNVLQRKRELQTANPNELEVFCVWHVPNKFHAYEIERYLHAQFDDVRKCGEWFDEKAVVDYLRNDTLVVPYYRFENVDW